MREVVFRRAVPEDAAAISELEILCFSSPWSKEAFTKELAENPAAWYLVGEIEGRIVASAGLWLIVDQGHIINVAVHPDFRRQGIGKALIAEMLRRTEPEGVVSYTLEVRTSNRAAIALYLEFGFCPAGIRKNYYENPAEDALLLWRNLPSDEATS
ncbi:MAG: ribosomal protein S18-alanine N-acetyltransferase [Eubacteriales bacterium]|jgi:ribosomal-protein-alanine N-acetyltransferase|nr:ribosomal protein S18-alanine N-acetyltransferase [Eubacteriales bacterium]MDD4285531.1 ribosomal protein S18-alanine N-acetyltransferase [Eubacteriales bacterium]NLV69615.1 ribosomal protein S18-alanine N-acetyltransferase [Clostridiales bacterium]HPF18071.1 ribosomal protein S18-alanine N-acetyltransferase [Bacillota bacterium]HRV33055.1 ribosomal protein S18-alanine N-acetyltransferase [Anaerovoracaceae bacterium]